MIRKIIPEKGHTEYLTDHENGETIVGFVVTSSDIAVLGEPANRVSEKDKIEDNEHNCDEMGCGWNHVLARIHGNIVSVHVDFPERFEG